MLLKHIFCSTVDDSNPGELEIKILTPKITYIGIYDMQDPQEPEGACVTLNKADLIELIKVLTNVQSKLIE